MLSFPFFGGSSVLNRSTLILLGPRAGARFNHARRMEQPISEVVDVHSTQMQAMLQVELWPVQQPILFTSSIRELDSWLVSRIHAGTMVEPTCPSTR